MTLQISQRGKEYLKTAKTLLGTAKTITEQAILEALADDYERRAEKASLDDATSIARSAAGAEYEWHT
jgi:hypothetical protein